MFGKWFKRQSVPEKVGDSSIIESLKQTYVKVFELVLSNMEESPVYILTNQLTVGSEIGNIVIADPSISPRHATFKLEGGVITLQDHGSVNGTFINGHKINPGKFIILEENDVILIGELEIKINVVMKTIVPEAPPETQDATKAATQTKISIKSKANVKPSKKDVKPVSLGSKDSSANALLRVFALMADVILAHVILVVFFPFEAFKQFIEFIPEALGSLIPVEVFSFAQEISHDYQFVIDMGLDFYDLFASSFDFKSILVIFIFHRMLTTLLFGVSLSEFLMGIRAGGNPLWARLGGSLRIIIGCITAPLIIFDLPAILSRRTFKEVITFTQMKNSSGFISTLGFILYYPLLFILIVTAPLVEGLEPPEPIFISDKITQRNKIKKIGLESSESSVKILDESTKMGLRLEYDSQILSVMNRFKFMGGQKKSEVVSSLLFYQRDLQREVELELMKTFNLKDLLSTGLKGNIFLYDKYPMLHQFIYEADDLHPAFRSRKNPKSEAKFASEVILLTKNSFSLGLENVFDIMQEQTPVIKSLINYRNHLMELLEYKDFSEIGFQRIGNIIFMKISYQRQKPFDLLIPLQRGQGKIYKLSLGLKENSGSVASRFYFQNMEKADWFPSDESLSENFSALKVFDLFNRYQFQKKVATPQISQALFGYYFEKSAEIFKSNDSIEKELWLENIKNLHKLIQRESPVSSTEGDDSLTKLSTHLGDLISAFENQNEQYFSGPHL